MMLDEMDMIGTGRILDVAPHMTVMLFICLGFLCFRWMMMTL